MMAKQKFSTAENIDSIPGLKSEMLKVFAPIKDVMAEKIYWVEKSRLVSFTEYKSRDGFIPHGHNKGGIEIHTIVPKCEEYDFEYLEFGEFTPASEDMNEEEQDAERESEESEGHLDALFRLLFKFEGVDHEGNLKFYINLCGGNGDAPYFRLKYQNDIFEAEFTCKSVAGIERAASKHIKALLKIIS